MQTLTEAKPSNPMRAIKLAKVIVHINVGKSGEELEKARKVLTEITGQKSCTKQAKMTIKDFGITEGEPIACLTTLRGEDASAFLKRGLDAAGNSLKASSFDDYGNFAFGIKEHIEIPGVRYDPEIGIFGMDICVSVNRPGQRVKNRRKQNMPISPRHTLTPEESIIFIRQTLGVEIE